MNQRFYFIKEAKFQSYPGMDKESLVEKKTKNLFIPVLFKGTLNTMKKTEILFDFGPYLEFGFGTEKSISTVLYPYEPERKPVESNGQITHSNMGLIIGCGLIKNYYKFRI
ncbi:hypothetical protein [Saccharicrinis sp. FJH54]|uniref:hypothetical protein n=1 Tax=Saccharicrinis sp. FJH54 TaxID=3344665 RepID=UPI0035D5152A